MKRKTLTGACVAGLFGIAAFAALGQGRDDAPEPVPGDEGASAGTDVGTADARCMRQTGSKIRPRDCTGARGRAHDRASQEASGRADVGTGVHARETATQVLNRLND